MAKLRNLRYKQESQSDSSFQFGLQQAALAYPEACLVLRVLGNDGSFPVDWADDWFLNEKIPDDWNAPASSYGLVGLAADSAKLKALTLVNPAETS